jgi:hypothetical protein
MVKWSCILHKNLFYPHLFIVLVFVFSVFDRAEAIHVTIDAGDPTANYQSLDLFFAALDGTAAASVPDTVLLSGSKQYTYTASQYVNNSNGNKKMVFLGTATNPDSFPIINHTGEAFYNFFQKTPTSFERLIFTGNVIFHNGNAQSDLTFSQCVIRDYKSKFFRLAGSSTAKMLFSNCLFVNNNTDTIFQCEFWDVSPHLEITNCTFDNNLAIFFSDQSLNSNMVFKNNIFSNNKYTLPGSLLKAITTNSITSESNTGYGSGCYQLTAADTANLYKFTSRTIPSHWKLGSTSKAIGFSSSTSSNIDIAGTSRGAVSPYDVGCWKFDNTLQIGTQPRSDTVVVNTNAVFKISVVSATALTYAWYRKGVDSVLSTTDSCSFKAVPTLDSTSYWCVVKNSGESKTSDTVTLRIINKPVILNDISEGISVLNGDSATFKISATGLKLSYRWHLGTSILKTDTLKPSCKIDTITKAAHDNALLFCEVINPAGSVNSLTDTLHVKQNLPVISTQPSNATVNQGQNATFTIDAKGNGPLTYAWYQTDSAKTKKTKLSSDSSILILPKVNTTSSGTAYYCVVYLYGDSVTSDLAYLKVNVVKPPEITDWTPGLETTVGSSASLYVTVNGNGLGYTVEWYKDGTLITTGADSTVYDIPSDIMSKEGTYKYRCIVTNDGGSDTSNIINVIINKKGKIYNSIILKGLFVNRSSIRLTITNFTELPVENDSLPYVETVGVWYKNSEYQLKPDNNSTNLIKLPLATLLARGVNNSFDTLINIPMGDAECDSICFIATPFWKPDSLPPFKLDNGIKVYSCGSDSVQNPLTFDITQPQIGVAALNIKGFSKLNKSNLKYVVTYFGNPGSYTYDTIEFPSADIFTKDYTNVLFEGLTHTISWGVYIRGIEGNYSDTIEKQIEVGYSQPTNDASLKIDSTEASEVLLKWSATTIPERIRIWYGKDTIPVFADPPFPSASHDSISVPGTQDTIRISGLHENTKYYFGLQLQRNGIWSGITSAARCFTTTKSFDPGKINNTIKITEASFDTLTNKFKINFTFDSTGSDKKEFYVGYTYSRTEYFHNNDSIKEGSTKISQFITDGGTNKIEIDFGNKLDFDTTYYFSLWAQSKNASWSEPTDSSQVTVNTPSLKWMEVTLFNANDSICTTFEGKIQFEKVHPEWYVYPWDVTSLKVKLDKYNFDQVKIPEGFKVVSIGVKFRGTFNTLESPKLHFGIRVDSLSQEYSLKDVNMYEYDSLTGNFKVIYTRDSDDNDSMVSVQLKLNEHMSPLVLMIDTKRPVVNITSDTASVLNADGTSLLYSVDFKDNVSNMKVTFKYGIGENAFSSTNDYVLGDSTHQFMVPSTVISDNSGVRVMLIVTDGRFTDTVDLSRVVYHDLVLKTSEMKWFPLCVHYELNSVEVNQLFESLSGPEKKYDNTKFRLFKWYDSLEYKTEVGKYVEYNMVNENDTLFDLKPGNLLWLKTRNPATLNFGKVKTLSLKKSYTVTLPPNTWTDVAVPFEYGIKIYDILKASGINSETKKVIINKWEVSDSKYSIATVHNPTMGGESHPEMDMSGSDNNVYTIYNYAPTNPTDTVTLVFPPIPSSMSEYVTPLTKQQAPSEWRFTITATTENEALNPIYIGFKNEELKKTLIPTAPSFGSLRMGVVENGNLYGIAVTHEKAEGYAYNLKFENKEVSRQSVKCNIVENVASGMNKKLYDPITGTAEDITADFTIDIDGQSSTERWLLVGSDAFVGKFIQKNVEFSLLQLYPNPFKGALNIKFMVPLAGVSSVNCMLFDPLGRRVWDFKIDKALHTGLNLFVWQQGQGAVKKLASGTYFFKLMAKDSKGKITGSKLAKLMYFAN